MIGADRYRVLSRGVRLRKAWRALDDLADSAASTNSPASVPEALEQPEANRQTPTPEVRRLLECIADDLARGRDQVLKDSAANLQTMLHRGLLLPQLLHRCAHELRIALGDGVRDRDSPSQAETTADPLPPRHGTSGEASDRSLGVLYLDGIRAPWNVGALFRAAEAFGINRVVLGPGSASPSHPRALRAAAGTVERVRWEVRDLPDLIVELEPALDWAARVFALETGGRALDDVVLPVPGIMVVGHEELGVSPAALRCAEAGLGRISIAFPGRKGSLNVSVAAGIALHAWQRQFQLRMTS